MNMHAGVIRHRTPGYLPSERDRARDLRGSQEVADGWVRAGDSANQMAAIAPDDRFLVVNAPLCQSTLIHAASVMSQNHPGTVRRGRR